MIAVPWFKFPWAVATADLAHALVQRAKDGDEESQGQLDEIKQHAAEGNKHAIEAWRYFAAIIRLVDAGQPPPSVILQMRQRVAVGRHHGHHGGGRGWGGPWGYSFYEPFFYEEMLESVAERAAEDAAAEAVRKTREAK